MRANLENDSVEVEFGAFIEDGYHLGLHFVDGEAGF